MSRANPGVTRFEWSHIFPDHVERVVVLTVREGVADLDEAVTEVRYRNGQLLERHDFEDLWESLEQSLYIWGGGDEGKSVLEILSNFEGKLED